MSTIDNTRLHYLKLILAGHVKPVQYVVPPEEHDRFRRFCVRLAPANPDTDFFAFGTRDGFDVIVATAVLQSVHLLWDDQILPESTELEWANNRLRECIRLFLRDRPTPLEVCVGEPCELAAAFAELDAEGLKSRPFQSWTDEDGEEFFVNASHIALLEVPSHVMELGVRHLEAEAQAPLPGRRRSRRRRRPGTEDERPDVSPEPGDETPF